MPRDTGIADRIRAMGVPVVEIAGWQTRGSATFTARGSVNHHTAGSNRGTLPSLGVLINGRSGIPGPLCNVAQSREAGEGNDKAYVIAAGRVNHAGKGSWRGLSGNSTVYGLEIEHIGTVPLAAHRQHTAAKIHAALTGGKFTEAMVCQHREWAPTRKIDAATQVDVNHFRALVKQYMAQPPKLTTGGAAVKLVHHPKVDGYYVCASDGGVFAYDAPFFGSMGGQPLNAPVVGMAVRPQGDGYILVGEDGGVFTFPEGAPFFLGSMGGQPMNAPIVDIEYDLEGDGYWMLGADGGIFTFGNATFHGSAAAK